MQYVFHPRSFSTSEMRPFSNGMRAENPGKPAEASVMHAMLFEVALRPVSRHERVGEQSAVVWKFAYLRPMSAMRRMVGVSIGPPKTSIAPKPTSSQMIQSTFGAPFGAFGCRNGSQSGVESRMSTLTIPENSLLIVSLLLITSDGRSRTA